MTAKFAMAIRAKLMLMIEKSSNKATLMHQPSGMAPKRDLMAPKRESEMLTKLKFSNKSMHEKNKKVSGTPVSRKKSKQLQMKIEEDKN